MHQAQTRVAESRLGLRLCPDEDPRRQSRETAGRHRRVHQGVSGDQGRPTHQIMRRDRDIGRLDGQKGCTGSHPAGQRAGVHRQGITEVAR